MATSISTQVHIPGPTYTFTLVENEPACHSSGAVVTRSGKHAADTHAPSNIHLQFI